MGRISKNSQQNSNKQVDALASHIGNQLLALRQTNQVTMRDVATGAGISNAFVCQIENGQRMPTARILWKLSKHFRVPINYWFKGFSD